MRLQKAGDRSKKVTMIDTASMKNAKLHDMDPISDLPDPIFHHIMSLLTTSDIARISILSKRFFFLCSTFPVIVFDESTFSRSTIRGSSPNSTNWFLDHILKSLQLRGIDSLLSEFRVKANDSSLRGISADHRFDSAIAIVLQNGVKCMDLNLGFAKYQLPDDFASKSITVLRLKGFKLDLCNLIRACPTLKTVSLTSCVILQDVKFSSQTLTEIRFCSCSVRSIKINAPNLHSFFFDSGVNAKPCRIDVSQCQDITFLSLKNVANGHDWIGEHVCTLGKLKTFILNGCKDIKQIRVWNEKLERLEIERCPLLASLELITRSLESFVFKEVSNRVGFCNISFIHSNNIKELSIENVDLRDDQWFETQISASSCLESLRIKGCFLEKIKVIHDNLRVFELSKCCCLVEAEIDTPKLVSFKYAGNVIEFSRMVTRSTCNATLSMKPWMDYNIESFRGWRNMLSFFGDCKSLKLVFSSPKEVMIPESVRETLFPPMYELKHFEVEIKSLDKIDGDLVDSLLWLSPLPKTLQISSASHWSRLPKVIIKFAYGKIKDGEDEDPSACCKDRPIKCWKHKLTSVEIHSTDAFFEDGLIELQEYFITNAKISDSNCFFVGLD